MTGTKTKIADSFYDMLEEKYGEEVTVIVLHESPDYYYLRVFNNHYAYHKETETWQSVG